MENNGLIKGVIAGILFIILSVFFFVKFDLVEMGFSSTQNDLFGLTAKERSLTKELKEAKIEQGLARYLAQINLASDEAKEVAKLINYIRLDNRDEIEKQLKTLNVYQDLPDKKMVLNIDWLADDLGFEISN